MSDPAPTAFHRSGTVSRSLPAVTATTLSRPQRTGQRLSGVADLRTHIRTQRQDCRVDRFVAAHPVIRLTGPNWRWYRPLGWRVRLEPCGSVGTALAMSVRQGGRYSGYGRQTHPSHRRLAAERLLGCDTPVTRFRGEARRNMLVGLSAGRGVARCAGNLPSGPTGRSPISAASSGKSRDKRACPIRSSNSSQLSRPLPNDSWSTLIARSRSATEASMRTYRMVATVTSPQGYPPCPKRAVWTITPPATCAGQGPTGPVSAR